MTNCMWWRACSTRAGLKAGYGCSTSLKSYVRASGAKLFVVEAAFGDRRHEVTDRDNPMHLQVRTDVELWHKERLLNLGIQRLPPEAKYVAWVDPDVHFTRHDWANETVHMLQHHPVVQMFGQAANLGPNEEVLWLARGIAKGWQEYGKPVWECPETVLRGVKDHPGLAWAFRREALDAMGGLLDFCIAGSADLHMVGAWASNYLLGHPHDLPPAYQRQAATSGLIGRRLWCAATWGMWPGRCCITGTGRPRSAATTSGGASWWSISLTRYAIWSPTRRGCCGGAGGTRSWRRPSGNRWRAAMRTRLTYEGNIRQTKAPAGAALWRDKADLCGNGLSECPPCGAGPVDEPAGNECSVARHRGMVPAPPSGRHARLGGDCAAAAVAGGVKNAGTDSMSNGWRCGLFENHLFGEPWRPGL